MTEAPEQTPKNPIETKQLPAAETFPLGQPWPGSPQAFPGGIQLPLPNLPAVVSFQHTQLWQGQFPPPDAVERYEAVLPGAFDRIIGMAERQQAATIVQVTEANKYRHADVKRAHYLGAAVTVAALGCSLVAYHMGSTALAVAFLSVPVLSVGKAILDSVRPKGTAAEIPEKAKSDSEQKKISEK